MSYAYKGKRTKVDLLNGVNYIPGTEKKIANNTWTYQRQRGSATITLVRYHDTEILSMVNGCTMYFSHGYLTKTTNARWNTFGHSHCHIHTHKHVTYFTDVTGTCIEIEDGIVVNKEGKLI